MQLIGYQRTPRWKTCYLLIYEREDLHETTFRRCSSARYYIIFMTPTFFISNVKDFGNQVPHSISFKIYNICEIKYKK